MSGKNYKHLEYNSSPLSKAVVFELDAFKQSGFYRAVMVELMAGEESSLYLFVASVGSGHFREVLFTDSYTSDSLFDTVRDFAHPLLHRLDLIIDEKEKQLDLPF